MNSFGTLFKISIFGESHNKLVGVLIEGVMPGLKVDINAIKKLIDKKFINASYLSSRVEKDFSIDTGVFNNYTTGAPILISFKNQDCDSLVYSKDTPRPSHADLVAFKKYNAYNDYRGAGTFSGRLCIGFLAASYFADSIIKNIFKLNLKIQSKVIYPDLKKDKKKLDSLKRANNSSGALINTVINKFNYNLGEPFFYNFESVLSYLIFSIPGVKGIEFGAGFSFVKMDGKTANDIILNSDGTTKTNNNGGILGGITNNNDIVFNVAVKPTASIGIMQDTVNIKTNKKTELKITGRHDTCFGFKVPSIIESVCKIAICDLLLLDRAIYDRKIKK